MVVMNQVNLAGNLTKDPEVRTTSTGTSVTHLRLAVPTRFRTANDESREEVCFVDIETWARQADACAMYLEKGSSVLVEGRLRMDEWENRDGEKRTRLLVRANRVHFMDPRAEGPVASDE